MRILLILGSLIVGTIAGIFLCGMIWQTSAQEGTMAMVIGGTTPIILGACVYLFTRMADSQRPSLRNARTWLTLFCIAAVGAGLFLLTIIAVFLLLQRG